MHYSEFIHRYETADEINSSHFEMLHRHLVKKFFVCINKRNDFQKQILQYNSYHVNIQMMKSILLYSLTRKRDQIEETMRVQMTYLIQSINLQQIE